MGFKFDDRKVKFIKNGVVDNAKTNLLTWLFQAMVLKGRAENGKQIKRFQSQFIKYLIEITGQRFVFNAETVYKIYDTETVLA